MNQKAPKLNMVTPENLYGDENGSGKYSLQAIVCHKGNSVHSGHYVTFIRKEIDGKSVWVLYNDEKIVKLEESAPNKIEDIQVNGYIYIYKKI